MKLWIIRHAKSDWGAGAASDFERPLNDRGRRDGPRMAAWLARQSTPARWIWTSDAVRARDTARYVAEGFAAAGPRLVEDHRLYDASAETVLDVLRETPADEQRVALVAHNPGLTYLVNLLAGTTVTDNLPTFGVALFTVPPPWLDLAFGHGELELLMAPKRLPVGGS
jgi:phosphohistidine phosphatase